MRLRLTKNNPMMSLWLSGANAALGKARGGAAGMVSAATRRAQKAMIEAALDQATRSAAAFWSIALKPLAPQKKSGKRRARGS